MPGLERYKWVGLSITRTRRDHPRYCDKTIGAINTKQSKLNKLDMVGVRLEHQQTEPGGRLYVPADHPKYYQGLNKTKNPPYSLGCIWKRAHFQQRWSNLENRSECRERAGWVFPREPASYAHRKLYGKRKSDKIQDNKSVNLVNSAHY